MYEWMMFVDAMMGLLIPILVIVAIKVSVPFAGKLKLVDSPNSRKLHACDVAVVGGLGMFLGVAVGLMSGEYSYDGLVLFAFLMLVLGVLDDRHDLSIISRLFAQMILAICAVSVMGIELRLLGDILNTGNLVLGNFSLIITVLAFLAGTNSFNAIDGLDGLAAGLGIIIFSSILVLASISESNRIVYLSSIYLFVLFPFLFFNLSTKHKVFMGDAGSLFIGFSIVWILIVSSQGEDLIFNPVTALWIYAIPLIDIVSVVCLRIKNNKSPFSPDRNHIHYKIKDKYNFSDKTVVLGILFVACFLSVVGVLGEIYGVQEWIMFTAFMVLFFLYLLLFLFAEKIKVLGFNIRT